MMCDPVAREGNKSADVSIVEVLREAWFIRNTFEPSAVGFRQCPCTTSRIIKKRKPCRTSQGGHGFPWEDRQSSAFQQFGNCGNRSRATIRIGESGFLVCELCQRFPPITIVQPAKERSKRQTENQDAQK